MKKFVYLCVVMLLSLNIMAQNLDGIRGASEERVYCRDSTTKFYKHLSETISPTSIPITPGWIALTGFCDEFNGTSLDENKWVVKDKQIHYYQPEVGFLNSIDNVSERDGKLYLTVTPNVDSIMCQNDKTGLWKVPKLLSGWIRTQGSFRYGYIETRCYLPKNHHYWPCFWTTGRTNNDYDEVDVFERTNGHGTDYPNIIRQNCYDGTPAANHSYLSQILSCSQNISGDSLVFGAEILPHEIVFYINGKVSSHVKYDETLYNSWNTFTCTDIDEMVPMNVIFSLTCAPTQQTVPLPQESAWFDYFRCYKLVRGSVDTYHPVVFSHSPQSTMVYPHVILGGNGHVANVTTPTAIWAEQDIVLDKGFELSAGTSFSARVISVPNPNTSSLYLRTLSDNP